MTGVEREFKVRIPSVEQARALRAGLGGPSAPPARQVNHFFDTTARALRTARLALRLRAEKGRHALALKGPELAGTGTLSTREEVEVEVPQDVARAVLAGERCPLATLAERAPVGLVRQARARVGSGVLHHLGSFRNERQRIGPLAFPRGAAGPALVFELDRTLFPDGSEQLELELELPDGAQAATIEHALRELLASLGIPFETAPSKAARFFRILERDEPRDERPAGTQL